MPTTRLFPLSTDVSGSNWAAFGASPAHAGLSDASDASGVSGQLSTFVTVKFVGGTAMTQLPANSGYIKQITLGFRGKVDIANSASATARVIFPGPPFVGPSILTVSVADLATVPTDYTAVLAATPIAPIPFTTINFMQWDIRSDFIAHAGVQTFAYELWLDVEWYPVTGVQIAQIY